MISTKLNNNALQPSEKDLLHQHLNALGLNENLWDLYQTFQGTESKYTKPVLLRIMKDNTLAMACYMVKCYDYGGTLTHCRIFESFIRKIRIPVYIWMRAGIAAETFSNPGFYNLNIKNEGIQKNVNRLLQTGFLFVFIHDLQSHKDRYPKSVDLPYVDEGIVNTVSYQDINDYVAEHKNIKKKIRRYKKAGGSIDLINGKVNRSDLKNIQLCLQSTAEKSVFTLPFQENYINMCISAASMKNKNIVHFICRNDNEFFGYHSFIKFKNQIRCINGAFNRKLPTTFHAYENMILKVIEYAIQNNIDTVYFGPVLNETKRRMMNNFEPTRLYVYSKNPLIRALSSLILKHTNLNAKEILQFSNLDAGAYSRS